MTNLIVVSKLMHVHRYNERYRDVAASMVPPGDNKASNPSFSEFVDYLLSTEPALMDKHWAPYYQVIYIE